MDATEIISLSMEELWTLFDAQREELVHQGIINEEQWSDVRFGINIPFDIYSHFSKYFYFKPKQQKIHIFGKVYNLEDFYSEIGNRKRIMTKSLIDFYSVEEDVFERPEDDI